ncbi:DUF2063 domain-containing protein [Pseudoruegeria sp. HB172150]|uniref:HvfC/BufC N-terminal domain-containing protein n=1 Tax=Pseudoruegeria sp. HB172150 TaxID=2721164 RepID=UPI001C1324A6|nr:DNA-binding domain-containing protein [Pseudoruegeria sp. HB172150]
MVSQDDFTQAILDAGRAVPSGLINPSGAPANKRFDVYRNNVAVSLTEALESAFPILRKLLGEPNFKLLAGAYLRKHPPSSPLMMFYGEAMPEFLRSFDPVRDIGYLPDVARLELAMRQSYHAADSEPIKPESLHGMPPEHLMAARLELAPAARLIRSRWPVYSIWRYNTESDAPKPAAEGQNVLITRAEFDPAPNLLPPGGGTFLAALLTRETFGAALESAVEQVPDFDIRSVLTLLLQGGAIAAITNEVPA